jgi:hypothetical protein
MRRKNTVSEQRFIYMGPRLHSFGIGYGNVFYNGLHPNLQQAQELCPAISGLLVPVEQTAIVRRELNFDYAHEMRGTTGKYVTFYREIQKWLNSQSKAATVKQTPTTEL